MAIKRTTKGLGRSEYGTDGGDGAQRPEGRKRQTRLKLRVSHGTQAKAPARGHAAAAPVGRVPMPSSRPRRPSRTVPIPTSRSGQLALTIASAALEKKAMNIEIIDLEGRADYADYLILMTGASDRHVHSLSDAIQESVGKQMNRRALSVEGQMSSSWVLIDFGEIVVHVFQEDTRRVYDIEGLWLDAARIHLP